MGIEDGLLLLEGVEDLAQAWGEAENWLNEHFELEAKRIKSGLETDTKRYLRGGRAVD